MIICSNIIKKYKNGSEDTAVINDVSLHIEKGEFVALTGKSGSGKSTLKVTMAALAEIHAMSVDKIRYRIGLAKVKLREYYDLHEKNS